MRINPPDNTVRIYRDEGYSGANTDRPAFQALMQDVENGLIQRVIVYKLDRISRSLSDFAEITKKFETYSVTFTSINEEFDTTSAMGRAMYNIVMIFAQLERETTQKRVKDAFYARMKQGFFVSGVAPIGFVKVPHEIGGIQTKKLEADPELVPFVRYIYQQYDEPVSSIGSILKTVNQNYQKFGLSAPISNVRLSRILRNPVYVRANVDVYHYLKNKGAEMIDAVTEFDGTRGCSVYADRHSKTTSKFTDLTGDYVKLGWHEGIIPAEQWIRVQQKLDRNKQLKNTGKGSYSWLSGIVKCGYCGYALTAAGNQKNGRQYINCGGRKQKICYERKSHITFTELEHIVESELLRYLKNYHFARISPRKNKEKEMHHLKAELERLEQEEKNLTEKLLTASGSEFAEIMQVLNTQLKQLHIQQNQLKDQCTQLQLSQTIQHPEQKLQQYFNTWNTLPMERKKAVCRLFISKVIFRDDRIEIHYLTEQINPDEN